jgi:hypothetical protein
MSGNPIKCRQRAARCMELANASKNANDRRKLTDLAASWGRLADKLERAQSMSEDSKRTQEYVAKGLRHPLGGASFAGSTDGQFTPIDIERPMEMPRDEVQQKSEKRNKKISDDAVGTCREKALDEAIENTFPASDPISTEQPV